MTPATGPFPRSQRIRRSREFRELSRHGRRRSSRCFVVLSAPSENGRLGLTVSRKVGNAVIRNRVKRRIREWFRREGHPGADGLDLVVIARPAAAGASFQTIVSELGTLVGATR